MEQSRNRRSFSGSHFFAVTVESRREVGLLDDNKTLIYTRLSV
jgi:hypothetical protein